MGNVAATVITEENFGMQKGLVELTVSAIWILAINMLTLKSVPARKILKAEPIIIIHKGKILEENLKKRYYNINDLLEMLRENGIFDPNQVEIALLETDGELSLLTKQNSQISKQTNINSYWLRDYN